MEIKLLGNIYGEQYGRGFAGNVYDSDGIAPTLMNMQGGGRQPMMVEEVKRIGNLSDTKTQSRTVYDADGISPTLCSGMDHGNTMPHICEKTIVAMRGRNPENPSDRTVGAPTEQRLEPNSQGICNTLTSVQKDNMVLEKGAQYRIRKLTPKECWRLMAFKDEDFHKAEAVNSNTQLYKQAGNSIVVSVLEAVFRQMRIQNLPTWNEEKGVWND